MTTDAIVFLVVSVGLSASCGGVKERSGEPVSKTSGAKLRGTSDKPRARPHARIRPRPPGDKLFSCSMHPQVRHAAAGKCPICGMDLIAAGPRPKPASLTCSMHPAVMRSARGKCPICGMDLIPVTPVWRLPAKLARLVRWPCGRPGACAPTTSSVEALLRAAAKNRDDGIRALAVAGFATSGVQRFLSDPAWPARARAAYVLARRRARSASVLQALRRASTDARKDPQGMGRIAALETRLRLGDKSALPALKRWLGSRDDTTVTVAAAAALRARVLKAQLEKLARRKATGPTSPIGQIALAGLALHGDANARRRLATLWNRNTFRVHLKLWPQKTRPRLRKLLAQPRPPSSAGTGHTNLWHIDHMAAASVLLEAGDPTARTALTRLLSGHPPDWIKTSALTDLARHVKPADGPIARRWLAKGGPEVRTTAAVLWLLASGRKVK